MLVAAALILAPWWLRLVRGLSAERAERIRSQERAEVAAHLHDSVLQTLALVQRRADDPREVASARPPPGARAARLAQRRARPSRGGDAGRRAGAGGGRGRGGATASRSRSSRSATRRSTTGGAALVAAAREAIVNAAKFAGGGADLACTPRSTDERTEVFVRDRGPGFDPDAVPADRRGVRESIVGRMERHGGRAAIHSAPGDGTEVELVLERA